MFRQRRLQNDFAKSVSPVLPPVRRASSWPTGLKAYLIMHAVWLCMYALLGKGFAYAGWSPFYVSELLLVLACVATVGTGRIAVLFRTPLGVLMGIFLAWQVVCMTPYLEIYGVDTLRDSAIWGYATFAWAAAALIVRLPGLLQIVVRAYRQFARLYLFLGPVAWLATLYWRDFLPRWPDTTVTVPLIKGGELCVHLAGIFALVLSGLGKLNSWWVFLIIADAMLGMSARGGLVAFSMAAIFIVLIQPRVRWLVLIFASGLTLMVTMAAFDLRFVVPGASREFSLDQLSDSIVSVVGNSDRADLEGTKTWRLTWWGMIRDYTVDGPYFWTGKGYGVNLADSDGFQVGTREEPLRSPHNSHMTFLARSGVPGLILWSALQLSWVALMLRSYVRARQLKLGFWSGLFGWFVAYWIAFMVSSGFDVFLEGPMAGIPFWTLFGLGWGSEILFRSERASRIARETASTPDYLLAHSS